MKVLKLVWKRWLKIAKVVGNFQGQVFLTVFYFVLVLPFGIGVALFADPLKMKKPGRGSNFSKWKHIQDTLASAHNQF